MTEEPSHMPPSRSPTARLFGAGKGLLAVPPTANHGPPVYVPVLSTSPIQNNGAYMSRKWTQEDQNNSDEKERRKAMNELVASWMDRLQLISVITTFFAAMEAELLGTTAPDPGDNASEPVVSQLANATLTGALVMHVFAAILAFLAAFFLIRFKLTAAVREEHKVESGLASGAASGAGVCVGKGAEPASGSRNSTTSSDPPIWSSNPHLEQVGPFRRGQPPTHLLDHCHSLCMWLSAVGFVLALVGVLAFAWSRLALSGGVFASVCMAVCLSTGVAAIFWPASSAHG
ncbi:hypothetical protein DICSQDRAFT_177821 [Dichomitus squalens LYAD-421 SS1]|uniref:uncharacterized protein n=1 Tax=Dichomitus squalens (strain LYAD-421) TaxID=732165 RepID=UPI0004411B59|nr:uncharacterized protein DICSQDRAFT_177821 [Dichomitus squalens LYAD-421 SS1]EJF65165.1 hypothetical protein DICSQDRAFT_177821 [Dichomitus squalens LYAD-421 SS1]